MIILIQKWTMLCTKKHSYSSSSLIEIKLFSSHQWPRTKRLDTKVISNKPEQVTIGQYTLMTGGKPTMDDEQLP